jgi:GH15 family glucan-1,4-alpha-glucosidase
VSEAPQPIESYGLLGDLQTAALVARNGSIDWLCLPRFDSPACFAALLADESAGRWRLAPKGSGECTRRRYRGDSLILETEWDTPNGSVRVIDCMPPRGKAADLVRVVEGVKGRVPMAMDLRLRFDYGHVVPWVRQRDGDFAAIAGPDEIWVRTPVPLEGKDFATTAEFEVSAGERVPFVLTHGVSYQAPPRAVDALQAVAETEQFWTEWMSGFSYDGDYSDAVRRSLVLLKALTYKPSGGIVAAATTSLPESIGGARNWDYRYCWLRDATYTLQALLGTGFETEAKAWREWLLRAVAGDAADLQIMYGVDGTRRITEYELPWLPGYEGSSPVRIGNAAAEQFQLDVWGEVLDGLALSRKSGLQKLEPAWGLQRVLLDFLEGHWQEPDNGLWEMRGGRRDFVHSKVMAWAGVDRGVHAVEDFGLPGPGEKWKSLREEIRADILAKGYDADRNTFTQSYGNPELDAATLLIPRVGFLPWDDHRVVGTVEAIEKELCQDGFVLRYQTKKVSADGLPGSEGAFLACSFWLADALYGMGREKPAREMFERLLGLRNDLGMLSEEYDSSAHRQVGNTPQAFSLVGLVNTARHLAGPPTHIQTGN